MPDQNSPTPGLVLNPLSYIAAPLIAIYIPIIMGKAKWKPLELSESFCVIKIKLLNMG